jgi:hypothetical protein
MVAASAVVDGAVLNQNLVRVEAQCHGPNLCPYSPECVEDEFSEIGLPLYGVLGSSLSHLPL